jgi:hypothetical protein
LTTDLRQSSPAAGSKKIRSCCRTHSTWVLRQDLLDLDPKAGSKSIRSWRRTHYQWGRVRTQGDGVWVLSCLNLKGLGLGSKSKPKGLGAGSVHIRTQRGWVLLCPDLRGLGAGSVSEPKGVWSVSEPKRFGSGRLTQQKGVHIQTHRVGQQTRKPGWVLRQDPFNLGPDIEPKWFGS